MAFKDMTAMFMAFRDPNDLGMVAEIAFDLIQGLREQRSYLNSGRDPTPMI